MFTTMSAQVPTETLLRLIGHLRDRSASQGSSQDITQDITQDVTLAIGAALDCWLAAQTETPHGAHDASIRGYQWKSLFLPEGTVLRSWSYGENNYACVEGDKIIHAGHAVSPNQFARSFGRTARNAWFDLSVRRPGDKNFMMADRLRKDLQRQRQRADLIAAQTVTTAASAAMATATATATEAATAAATAAVATACPAAAPPPDEPRTIAPGPDWNLPERRKFRMRLEDVDF